VKAALLYGIKDIRVENLAIPKLGTGEALVKIKAATTCGTDIKIFQRGYLEKVIKFPTIFGHEWAGDVVELGEGETWLEEGMRVRAGNSTPCFRCTMCWKGKFNLCENMIWIWGAYAEYIKIPAPTVLINTQEIPPNLSYEEAAVTEPLACVLHGIEEVHMKILPLAKAIMVLGIAGGWGTTATPFLRADSGGTWLWAFLTSGLALIVLAVVYLSLALAAFAIAVTNIRRRHL